MFVRMSKNILEVCRRHRKKLNLYDVIWCRRGGGEEHSIYRVLAGTQDISGTAEMSIRILVNTLEVCRGHRKKLNLNEVNLCWGGQEEQTQYTGFWPGPRAYLGKQECHLGY